jgi:hypothetical protein
VDVGETDDRLAGDIGLLPTAAEQVVTFASEDIEALKQLLRELLLVKDTQETHETLFVLAGIAGVTGSGDDSHPETGAHQCNQERDERRVLCEGCAIIVEGHISVTIIFDKKGRWEIEG